MGIDSGSVYIFSYRSVKHGRRYRNLPPQMRSLMIGLDVVFAKSGYPAVIRAVYDDERGNDIGSGYVYNKVVRKWVENGKIFPENGAAND